MSWTTGTCRAAIRSASMLPWTSPSSTPGADALELRRAPRSSSVVLPAPGALIRLTTATRARSKSSRLACAIVWLASSASSATLTLVRCIAPPRLRSSDLDRLDLELVAADDLGARRARRRGSGTRAATGSRAARGPRAARGAGSHSCPQVGQRIQAPTSSSSSRRPRRRCRGRRSRSRRRASRARPGAGCRPARRPRSPGGRRRGAAPCRRSRSRSRARASAAQPRRRPRRCAARRSSRAPGRRPARPPPRPPARARGPSPRRRAARRRRRPPCPGQPPTVLTKRSTVFGSIPCGLTTSPSSIGVISAGSGSIT